MSFITTTVLGWVLPTVLGPLVYWVSRHALNVHLAIDDAPPILKRAAVAVIGVGLASAFAALGVALPTECLADGVNAFSEVCTTALSAAPVVEGVTAALVAMVIHALKKSRPNE